MEVEVAMLTGNSGLIAQPVADELDIGHYSAEVFPRYKDQKILKQQKAGKMMEMVSVGINDASALTRAGFGIAIGSGTDVAFESAGIILVKSNLLDVVKTFNIIKASCRNMIQNLTSATGYNLIALPLAARILAHC